MVTRDTNDKKVSSTIGKGTLTNHEKEVSKTKKDSSLKAGGNAVSTALTKEQVDAFSDEEYDTLEEGVFLLAQRLLLEAEKSVYLSQAEMFKEEAATLARESEPGDVQFDEESGEGGTATIERERDLALLASHLATVVEIDEALEKFDRGNYGICESCRLPIPRIRLRALPFARLCVKCKSGGFARR